MNRTYTPSQPGKMLPGLLLFLLLSLAVFLFIQNQMIRQAPSLVYATATVAGGTTFSYEVTTSDLTVDWQNGGDFDPKDKCPEDFFAAGFTVICRKMKQRGYFKFLYHKKKKLLYRIDQDVVKGKAKIGLHWVTGTNFNAKYRIADKAFKGGRATAVPNAKGGVDKVRFKYGEAVSKRRVRPDRELFRETHIDPKQCQSWWDLFNFVP